jgi:hypothetical protein
VDPEIDHALQGLSDRAGAMIGIGCCGESLAEERTALISIPSKTILDRKITIKPNCNANCDFAFPPFEKQMLFAGIRPDHSRRQVRNMLPFPWS